MLRVINISLEKPSGTMIPTSGERALSNDVYVVYLRDSEQVPRFLVNDRDVRGLIGKRSNDGRNFTEEDVLPVSELADYSLWVQHYYRGWTFYHDGMPSFFWNHVTHYPFFRVGLDRLVQSRFNKQLLTRMDRFKVLEHITDQTIKDRDFRTSPFDLMTEFYTARWVHRPDKDELLTYYTLLLEALEETQDLQAYNHGHRYGLKPKALNTITDFALEERRHNENRNIQIGIVALTVILLIVGAAQAVAAVWEAFFKAAT
ncbi:hypothetical protein J2857_006198 [Neorhizobium galegae]|uniref:hypothetical protein n=1 Tax=Neorhizobium galegae TaxID=399 RepID=UPI001AE903CB|nr:hypothetical protein [Neorhizobium galegae]MBP2563399.1 hypothetical protein [Neorhizobium galegae]